MTKSVRTAAPVPRPAAKSPITRAAVVHVRGAVVRQNGGGVPKRAYVGRTQQAGAKVPK